MITFTDFCAQWKKEILENYRPSTRGFYGGTLDRWIIPISGNGRSATSKSPMFKSSGATALHLHNVPLKVQQDIMGHANPDMSLLYTEAELTYRRSAIKLLEEAIFGVHNETLTDAIGRELSSKAPPNRANLVILNPRL